MYVILSTQEIKSEQEIRAMYPNIAFPKVFSKSVCDSIGIAPILESPRPEPTSQVKQVILDGAVQDSLGNYVQKWIEVDMFQDTEEKTKEEQEQEYLQAIYKASIPTQVTMRQARLALLQAGLLDDIELAINNLENETVKRAVQIEWEYAQDIRRDWQALITITEAIDMTEEQLDELFLAASKL